VKEGEYGTNTMYTCVNLEKCDVLKLFQEWEKVKENDGWG
jgi:hypothetical protein